MIEEHLNQIFEGLNEPIDVTLDRNGDGYIGFFNIEDKKYEVFFIETSDSCFIFSFTREGEHTTTRRKKGLFSYTNSELPIHT